MIAARARWAHGWPPLPLARHFVLLGAAYWLTMRVALAVASALAGGMDGVGDVGGQSPLAVVPLAAGAALVAVVEGRRRRHFHFLGNLGVRPWTVVALWTAPVVLLELCSPALR